MNRTGKLNRKALIWASAAMLAVGGLGGFATAADTVGTAPAVKAVIECRSITDPTQRLACFDKTVGDMAGADAKGDLITLDQEQRKTIRKQAFGFTMPSFTLFDKGEKAEEARKASFKITEAWQGQDRHWNIRLETGAVWRQTDDAELFHDPHAGSIAIISKGALSSYFMKIDGEQAFRAMRVS